MENTSTKLKFKQSLIVEYDKNIDLTEHERMIVKINHKIGNIRSPLRFPGSKAQAIKLVKPEWEKVKHDEYREPFLGGGAIFFAKPLVTYNWLNDLSKDLITTFKVMANPELRKELIEKVSKEEASKSRHIEMKGWEAKSKIDVAHRYFYLNRTSYSGIMKKPAWGYHPTKSVPPERWGKRIEIAGKKLEAARLTNLDFEDVINTPKKGKAVFMFVDPPYYLADQKRAYQHWFKVKDHERLAKILKNTKHKFVLTYDNCEEVKELYSWANIKEVSWRYHTANSNKANRKMGQELIITNF